MIDSNDRMSPIAYFFICSCLFSWSIWGALILSRNEIIPFDLPMPLYFLGAFGPLIGAIFTSYRYGINSPKNLFRQLLVLKTKWQWYAWAIGIPIIAYAFSSLLTYYFLEDTSGVRINGIMNAFLVFFTMIFIVVGEEAGWRGFALPLLEQNYSAFESSVVIWLMWGFWHLPAFGVSGIFSSGGQVFWAFLGFMILLFPLSLIFTWLHHSSKGKTILAVVLHAAIAATSSITNLAIEASIPFFISFTIIYLLIGIIILIKPSPEMNWHSHSNPSVY